MTKVFEASAYSFTGAVGVGGVLTVNSLLATIAVDYAELRLAATAGTNLHKWRLVSGINGSADGSLTVQHTTDNFVSNFTNSLVLDTAGDVTVGAALSATGTIGTANASFGNAVLSPGDATHTGYLAFYNASSVRQGYIGYAAASGTIALETEGSATGYAVTGLLTVAGTLTVGADTASSVYATIDAAAAAPRNLTFATASKTRWALYTDTTTESGSNAGCNLWLGAFTDAGSFNMAVMEWVRSTGLTNIYQGLSVGGTTTLTGALSVSGTVSGAGFTAWAASPPAIGGTAAAAGTFTALNASSGNVLANVGRNLLHNGLFRVQQRGAGAWTTASYTADRWLNGVSGSTCSTTMVALSDTDRAAIGDEAASYAIQLVVGGTSGAGDYVSLVQRIEGVRRTSGKTVTLSYWARATSGTPKLGNDLQQCFGTGGSPSANVASIGSSAVTLSTTWTRYSMTVAVPSASGKTFGTTANTDWMQAAFWFSAGATLNAEAGSIGVQSATFLIWGVQLEVSSAATQLEKPDLALELHNCQRFFQNGQTVINGYGVTGAGCGQTHPLPVAMRASPTVATTANGNTNVSGYAVTALSNAAAIWPNGTVTTTGGWTVNVVWTATADL